MTNIKLLKSKMALFGDTIGNLSEELRKSRPAVSTKVNGEREFKQDEIQFIMNRYQLTPQEVVAIFFTD